jgi:hypothetical protein
MRMHKNFYLAGAILFLIDLLIPCSTLKRRAKFSFEVNIWVYRLFRHCLSLFMKSYLDIERVPRNKGLKSC